MTNAPVPFAAAPLASGALASVRAPSALSLRAMSVFGVVAAMTFSATGGAPTPVFHLYQEAFGLTPFALTLIFAAYVFALLAALLTVGSLSDYIGRRPVIFAALALNVVAMLLFIDAQSAPMLIAARVAQGFATGAAVTAIGAAILDANRARGPLLNSITTFAGLTVGSLASSALVAYAPFPMRAVFAVLLVLSVIEAIVLVWMPETAVGKPGAFASLRPHANVPARARATLLRVSPVNIAGWALGGFYFSLMPSLVRVATGVTSPMVGGGVVATLTLAATVAVALFRQTAAVRGLALGAAIFASGVVATLAGVDLHNTPVLLMGTAIAGFGFGAAFSSTIRMVLPLAAANERAGLLAAFYVESYLAFALPAVIVGLVAPTFGLALSTYVYGAAIVLLAVTSLIALGLARRAA